MIQPPGIDMHLTTSSGSVDWRQQPGVGVIAVRRRRERIEYGYGDV
jgi:hypothetical protein